jgi:hypothetical protein
MLIDGAIRQQEGHWVATATISEVRSDNLQRLLMARIDRYRTIKHTFAWLL